MEREGLRRREAFQFDKRGRGGAERDGRTEQRESDRKQESRFTFHDEDPAGEELLRLD